MEALWKNSKGLTLPLHNAYTALVVLKSPNYSVGPIQKQSIFHTCRTTLGGGIATEKEDSSSGSSLKNDYLNKDTALLLMFCITSLPV